MGKKKSNKEREKVNEQKVPAIERAPDNKQFTDITGFLNRRRFLDTRKFQKREAIGRLRIFRQQEVSEYQCP